MAITVQTTGAAARRALSGGLHETGLPHLTRAFAAANEELTPGLEPGHFITSSGILGGWVVHGAFLRTFVALSEAPSGRTTCPQPTHRRTPAMRNTDADAASERVRGLKRKSASVVSRPSLLQPKRTSTGRVRPGMIRTCDLCLRTAARRLRSVLLGRRETARVAGLRVLAGRPAAWVHTAFFLGVGTLWARSRNGIYRDCPVAPALLRCR